jgi:hypothetical protein
MPILQKIRAFASRNVPLGPVRDWIHLKAGITQHKRAWDFPGPAVQSMSAHGMTDDEIADHLEGIARLIRRRRWHPFDGNALG